MQLEAVVVVLHSGELKLELLSTWILYESAPVTEFQSKYGVSSQVEDPWVGSARPGAVAGGTSIVRVRGEDHEPVPHDVDALTRQ